MKLNTLKVSRLVILISLVLFSASCRKNSDKTSPTEAAENNAFAEAQFNDVTTLIDQASVTGSVTFGAAGTTGATGINGILGSTCATVSVDTVSNPRSIVIDFGTANCLCLDNRLRRGKILASYTGRYRDAGTVITISFDSYFVNEYKISGTKSVTNQGLNQSGNLVYKVEVSGAITRPFGGSYTWNSIRFREWKEGSLSPLNILDDVYGITGEANGTTTDGNAYTINITQELIRKMNCRWFESGKISLSPAGLPTLTLDYGNSGCDANANINLLGSSYPILLQ